MATRPAAPVRARRSSSPRKQLTAPYSPGAVTRRRLVSARRPRTVRRRVAGQRRRPPRSGPAVRARVRVRHAHRPGHRQADAAPGRAERRRHVGGDDLAGVLARAPQTEPLPDHDQVRRAVDHVETDVGQHLRAERARRARRRRRALRARPAARARRSSRPMAASTTNCSTTTCRAPGAGRRARIRSSCRRSEIIHDRMVCLFHPLVGMSPIYACATGGARKASRFRTPRRTFFTNGSQPSGVLTAPAGMTPDQLAQAKTDWDTFNGTGNAGRSPSSPPISSTRS